MTHHRDFNVLAGGQGGDEIVQLEHEANRPGAEAVFVADLGQILPVDENLPAGRFIQRANHIEQGAFTAAAGTHHGDQFALSDLEVNAVQGVNLLPVPVNAGQVASFN